MVLGQKNYLINLDALVNNMSDQEIIDYYDTHWHITLAQLSRMTGRSVEELKKILMQ